jgi:chromosome segregation ATPase
MANNYSNIVELSNKNNMSLSNTIKRDYGIPLDHSSVQETYEAALDYAQNSTLAYIGQPISVGDTLYVVTDEAGGYLKAVGTTPTADEKSIAIDEDGNITLAGFEAASNATLPRKRANGTLEWVPVSAIVAGDGNTTTTVQAAEDSSITVTPKYDAANDEYTYILDVNLPAISDHTYSITKETSEGKVIYNLTKDGEVVGESIEVIEAQTDEYLSGRVSSLEANIASVDTRLSDIEEHAEQIDTFFATVNNPDETIDTLAEIQKYIADDKTGAAAMLASINKNAEDIALLTGGDGASIKSLVDEAISEQSIKDAATYATQAALAEVRTKADAAAVKSAVDAALADKVDNSTLNSYYTKEQTCSQEEINTFVDDLTEAANSAANLANEAKNQIASQGAEINTKLAEIEEAQEEQDRAIQVNADAIDAINDETSGILARATAAAASDAQKKINSLENGAVAANTANISAINSQIEGVNANIGTLNSDIGVLRANDDTLLAAIQGEIATRESLAELVNDHETDIIELQNKEKALETQVLSNTAKFGEYSNTAEVDTKIADAIAAIDSTSITNAIATNAGAIQTNATAIADEASRADTEEKRLEKLIQSNEATISALETTLNAVIENDDTEVLNSIKELAAWVSEHESDVLPAITTNTEALETLTGNGEGSVAKTVTDAINDIPVAASNRVGLVKTSSEITAASDGTLSLGNVSTDKLVLGTATLVLKGGNASS